MDRLAPFVCEGPLLWRESSCGCGGLGGTLADIVVVEGPLRVVAGWLTTGGT